MKHTSSARLLLALLLACSPLNASAVPSPDAAAPDGGARDGGHPSDAGAPLAAPTPVDHIAGLLAGTLDLGVEPQSLFDVPLDDEAAISVERQRAREVLRAEAARPEDAGLPADVDAQRWLARVGLDRARLAFYELPAVDRAALLQAHARRVEAARPQETDEARRAREASADQARALEAARLARSEAERLIGEELARLIGVEQQVVTIREKFKAGREALLARKDVVLGWQRKVRDARAGGALEADATYDALRRSLRVTRDEIDAAIDTNESDTSAVPAVGDDPLAELPPDLSTEEVRERRTSLEAAIREAKTEERLLSEDRAEALLEEANTLNRERLGLLRDLSSDKRNAITGFSDAGLDQARSEARHLFLTLRYHWQVLRSWLRSLRTSDGSQSISIWSVVLVLVPWVVITGVFFWWRKRSPALIAAAEKRAIDQDREERRNKPSLQTRVLDFLAWVHRPLEWLIFFWASVALLPQTAQGLLEVQLFTVVTGWTLGGTFIVNSINAFASISDITTPRGTDEVGPLRLRSLRLVGRVVVAIILILVLSSRLVGKGTVYSWVLSSAWLAAVPVALVLVLWWRNEVFKRVERLRRKSKLQNWVLANRTGWKSFLAATVAAVQLFSLGSYKAVRNWVAAFEPARRALAWLFKRELDKLAEDHPATELKAIDASAFESLSPERPPTAWLPSPADEHLSALQQRLAKGHCGVIAVVGGRGAGKSSLLQRLEQGQTGVVRLECTNNTGVADLKGALGEGVAPNLVSLDDAQRIIRPVLGGLKTFDDTLAFAREHSEHTLWVFTLDDTVWPFLRRARDSRLLFDEVLTLEGWADGEIGKLLTSRSGEAGLNPSFEDLLDELPPNADEIDKQEALEAKRTGYFRMVWDYASGNPAVALDAWRHSLGLTVEGAAHVRHLQTPKPARLESLPDSSVFVLRAVLQMAPAQVAEVAQATRLTETAVINAFSFGKAHGYLEAVPGGVQVSWPWLRPVRLFLERRHLLVNS